jgi:SAM-dependent methyltransferase
MPTIVNTDAAKYWTAAAPTWVEMKDSFDEISGEIGYRALERLALQPGETVLDVGCGTGGTTLELAKRVGASGAAVGADIALGMVERARENAALADTANASFVHADAQVHDFGADRFDAAYSRFGVMFFTDPVAAFSNIRRGLRADGRLSFACWQNVFANEWMLVPGAAAMTELGAALPPVADANAPGPFSLSDPDRVISVLTDSGFHDVDVVAHNDFIATPEARIPEIARISTRTGLVAELLADHDYDTRARVVAAIEAAMRARIENGEVRAARGALLVTART